MLSFCESVCFDFILLRAQDILEFWAIGTKAVSDLKYIYIYILTN